MKGLLFRIVSVILAIAAVGYGGYRYFNRGAQTASAIATAIVQRGDVSIRAYTRGELQPVRTYELYAPNLNGTVQVTRLAAMGSLANEKDLIVEYDDSELLATIESDNLNIQATDEEIKQQRIAIEIQQSQDKVQLLTAQFNVRRAELNVEQNEVLDRIAARNNDLQLEQAKRTLQQTQTNIEMRNKQFAAQLATCQFNRNRSVQLLRQDQARLRQTNTLTPLSGLVNIKQNMGSMFTFGRQMPDIRAGDTLQAGMSVAHIIDLSEMEITAKVGEIDRASLNIGQAISITLDAISGKRFPGVIKSLGGSPVADIFSSDPTKKFDVVFSVDMRALLAGIGLSKTRIDETMKLAEANAKRNLVSVAPGGGGMFAAIAAMLGFSMGDLDDSATEALAAQMPGRGAPGAPNAAPGAGVGAAPGGGAGGAGMPDASMMAAFSQMMGQSSGQAAPAGGAAGRGSAPSSPAVTPPAASTPAFTEADRANAKLPPAPEENETSGGEALLRPGLLADVEIEIQKIPNALHVPKQAFFQKNGVPTLYVKRKDGKFEARQVKFVAQSESSAVIEGAIQPGEVVALVDPTMQKNGSQTASSAGTATPSSSVGKATSR